MRKFLLISLAFALLCSCTGCGWMLSGLGLGVAPKMKETRLKEVPSPGGGEKAVVVERVWEPPTNQPQVRMLSIQIESGKNMRQEAFNSYLMGGSTKSPDPAEIAIEWIGDHDLNVYYPAGTSFSCQQGAELRVHCLEKTDALKH